MFIKARWECSLGSIGVVGALGASLVCGELSWRLVEAPCLALRRRFAAGAENPIAGDPITGHSVAEAPDALVPVADHPVAGHPTVEVPGDRLPLLELPVPVPVAGR